MNFARAWYRSWNLRCSGRPVSDRKERILVNSFRFWFTRFRGDSRKAHILGECQTRGSITYDSSVLEFTLPPGGHGSFGIARLPQEGCYGRLSTEACKNRFKDSRTGGLREGHEGHGVSVNVNQRALTPPEDYSPTLCLLRSSK
jgi:hypothetical protein